MSNSINTNIAAYFAQANITQAASDASSSVARLSSGNRIVKASDDVAALATGASLLTTVTALRSAQTNASQGTSLLQVADGALTQIQNILQQQKSIALQAGSGSLTNTDRGFLNQQFQALAQEINSLSGSTTFNGVNLLDGSLSTAAVVQGSTSQSSAANATVSLITNATNGDTITIAGVQLTATTGTPTTLQFKVGATSADTIANLATKLNSLGNTVTYAGSLGQANFVAQGSTLLVNARTGGSLGDNFRIDTTAANSTLITGSKAAIGGSFGGSTVNFFSTGFLSATSSVTAATTAAAETPFVAGDSITATVGSGSTVTLYTLSSGDTLTNIVNGINVNRATTGISAVLSYDPTASRYNIQLKSTTTSSAIAINGGANFYNVTDRTHSINGATQTQTLFTNEYAVNNIVAGNTLVGGSLAAPFVNGNTLKVTVGSGAATTIATLATGDTLTTLVAKINASAGAKSLGLHAEVSSNSQNIDLTYADATGSNNLLIDGGTSFFNTDATGKRNTNGLNNHVSSLELFSTGFTATSTAVSAATAAAATPFQDSDAISVTIPGVNGGSAISLGTVGASSTLAQLAASINASAGAAQYGVHAEVVQDTDGTYNIALNVATNSSAAITFNGGTNYYNGSGVLHSINPSGQTTFAAPDQTQVLFTSTFASGLTAGAAVVTGSPTATAPFKTADTLSVYTANGTVQISTGLALNDTLANIVTNINARAAAAQTGVTAALSTDGKNINLYSATKIIGVNGGTNFYSNATDTTGAVGTSGLNNNATQLELFNSTLAAAISSGAGSAYVLSGAGAATGTVPFKDGDVVKLSINGAAAINITSGLAASTTVAQLIANINGTATAQAAGVHAYLDVQDGTHTNIRLVVDNHSNQPISSLLISSTNGNTTNLTTSTGVTTNNSQAAATATTVGTATDTASHQKIFGLAGGADTGLGYGSTSVTGTVGDSLITGLSQNAAKVTISFPDVAANALSDAGNFNSDGSVYLTLAGHNFTFVTSATAPDQIEIGASLQETLDNAVSTINQFLTSGAASGNTAYQLNQLSINRNGNSIVIQGKGISDPTQIDGTAASAISITGFTNGAPVSNGGNLTNSSRHSTGTYGVDVSGISNADFNSKLSGFTANYVSSNVADVSIKVGNYTYTAAGIDTSPTTANETIRFFSNTLADGSNGGYFDVQLAQNQGTAVNGQTDANTLATRFNSAFSTLNIVQERSISSYNGTQSIVANGISIGSLVGSKVSASLPSFSGVKLTGVDISAPTTGTTDAQISLTINGIKYNSQAGLGNQLGANQTYRLTSAVNPNNFVDFTTGNTSIQLANADDAKAVQAALESAFGANSGAAALSFQIGASVSDTLSVSLGSAKTSNLYNGEVLDVSTQAGASHAGAVLDEAINAVTALRAGVGALESQFNFASAALQSSVQNEDAARGQLLDTDIATESTAYATSQVKLQAGISVLAQANQSLQALLKLIG